MKIDSRLQTLLSDLKTRKSQCICGAVMYPRNWMKKTQERAKAIGLIEECKICSGDTCQYLKVNYIVDNSSSEPTLTAHPIGQDIND